jgi:murein DD-endopeptidase MepM/ murein hydrolase activator NlpD
MDPTKSSSSGAQGNPNNSGNGGAGMIDLGNAQKVIADLVKQNPKASSETLLAKLLQPGSGLSESNLRILSESGNLGLTNSLLAAAKQRESVSQTTGAIGQGAAQASSNLNRSYESPATKSSKNLSAAFDSTKPPVVNNSAFESAATSQAVVEKKLTPENVQTEAEVARLKTGYHTKQAVAEGQVAGGPNGTSGDYEPQRADQKPPGNTNKAQPGAQKGAGNQANGSLDDQSNRQSGAQTGTSKNRPNDDDQDLAQAASAAVIQGSLVESSSSSDKSKNDRRGQGRDNSGEDKNATTGSPATSDPSNSSNKKEQSGQAENKDKSQGSDTQNKKESDLAKNLRNEDSAVVSAATLNPDKNTRNRAEREFSRRYGRNGKVRVAPLVLGAGTDADLPTQRRYTKFGGERFELPRKDGQSGFVQPKKLSRGDLMKIQRQSEETADNLSRPGGLMMNAAEKGQSEKAQQLGEKAQNYQKAARQAAKNLASSGLSSLARSAVTTVVGLLTNPVFWAALGIIVFLVGFVGITVATYCVPLKELRDKVYEPVLTAGKSVVTMGEYKSDLRKALEKACGIEDDTGCGESGSSGPVTIGTYGPASNLLSAEECKQIVKYWNYLKEAGSKYGIDPTILGAKIARETNVGLGGTKQNGNECAIMGDPNPGAVAGRSGSGVPLVPPYFGYGISQVDWDSYPDFIKSGDWKDCRKSILKGAEIYNEKRNIVKKQLAGRTSDQKEIERQTLNAYNAGRACTIGTDDCTTGRNYGSQTLGLATDVQNCLKKNNLLQGESSGAKTAYLSLSSPTFEWEQNSVNLILFNPIQANAQSSVDIPQDRARLAGLMESGKISAQDGRDISNVRYGGFKKNLVILMLRLYDSGISFRTGSNNGPARGYGGHGAGVAMDFVAFSEGPYSGGKSNYFVDEMYRNANATALVVKAVNVMKGTGLLASNQLIGPDQAKAEGHVPLGTSDVGSNHEEHIHFQVDSTKTVSAATGVNADCEPCPPNTTPGATASKPTSSSSSGAATSSSSGSSSNGSTGGNQTSFIINPFGVISVEAAYGSKPSSYNGLSSGHKAFLQEVASAKGYAGYKDAGKLSPDLQKAFSDMSSAASKEGLSLSIVSGYRSYDDQIFTYFNNGDSSGQGARITRFYSDTLTVEEKKIVKDQYLNRAFNSAPPGYSEHSTGLAIDINTTERSFANTQEYAWLKANASKYGFKLSYPENSSAGAGFEPWHWLFVGNAQYKNSTPIDSLKSGGAAAVDCVTSATTSFSGKFVMPMSGTFTSPFGPRVLNGVGGFHQGVDISTGGGGKVVAAGAGKVVSILDDNSCGKGVLIEHKAGLQTLYCHAQTVLVNSGQTVNAGQQIMVEGSTGRSTGPHLHFGVKANGSYVNPCNYLPSCPSGYK